MKYAYIKTKYDRSAKATVITANGTTDKPQSVALERGETLYYRTDGKIPTIPANVKGRAEIYK